MTSYVVSVTMDIVNILVDADSPEEAKDTIEDRLEDVALFDLEADGVDIEVYKMSEFDREEFE